MFELSLRRIYHSALKRKKKQRMFSSMLVNLAGFMGILPKRPIQLAKRSAPPTGASRQKRDRIYSINARCSYKRLHFRDVRAFNYRAPPAHSTKINAPPPGSNFGLECYCFFFFMKEGGRGFFFEKSNANYAMCVCVCVCTCCSCDGGENGMCLFWMHIDV